MPIATDSDYIWRVYDPEGGGCYTNWRSRSHWTRRHNAARAAAEINHWREGRDLQPAVVKKYKLVEVEDD